MDQAELNFQGCDNTAEDKISDPNIPVTEEQSVPTGENEEIFLSNQDVDVVGIRTGAVEPNEPGSNMDSTVYTTLETVNSPSEEITNFQSKAAYAEGIQSDSSRPETLESNEETSSLKITPMGNDQHVGMESELEQPSIGKVFEQTTSNMTSPVNAFFPEVEENLYELQDENAQEILQSEQEPCENSLLADGAVENDKEKEESDRIPEREYFLYPNEEQSLIPLEEAVILEDKNTEASNGDPNDQAVTYDSGFSMETPETSLEVTEHNFEKTTEKISMEPDMFMNRENLTFETSVTERTAETFGKTNENVDGPEASLKANDELDQAEQLNVNKGGEFRAEEYEEKSHIHVEHSQLSAQDLNTDSLREDIHMNLYGKPEDEDVLETQFNSSEEQHGQEQQGTLYTSNKSLDNMHVTSEKSDNGGLASETQVEDVEQSATMVTMLHETNVLKESSEPDVNVTEENEIIDSNKEVAEADYRQLQRTGNESKAEILNYEPTDTYAVNGAEAHQSYEEMYAEDLEMSGPHQLQSEPMVEQSDSNLPAEVAICHSPEIKDNDKDISVEKEEVSLPVPADSDLDSTTFITTLQHSPKEEDGAAFSQSEREITLDSLDNETQRTDDSSVLFYHKENGLVHDPRDINGQNYVINVDNNEFSSCEKNDYDTRAETDIYGHSERMMEPHKEVLLSDNKMANLVEAQLKETGQEYSEEQTAQSFREFKDMHAEDDKQPFPINEEALKNDEFISKPEIYGKLEYEEVSESMREPTNVEQLRLVEPQVSAYDELHDMIPIRGKIYEPSTFDRVGEIQSTEERDIAEQTAKGGQLMDSQPEQQSVLEEEIEEETTGETEETVTELYHANLSSHRMSKENTQVTLYKPIVVHERENRAERPVTATDNLRLSEMQADKSVRQEKSEVVGDIQNENLPIQINNEYIVKAAFPEGDFPKTALKSRRSPQQVECNESMSLERKPLSEIKQKSRTLELRPTMSIIHDSLFPIKRSATLGRAESHRRPRLQPKPALNDDHLFPESVTPSKVDKELSARSETMGLPQGTYDVPYIDDDAFLPKRMRDKTGKTAADTESISGYSSDGIDWYEPVIPTKYDPLDPTHIADTNECVPSPIPGSKTETNSKHKKPRKQPKLINESDTKPKRRRPFIFCGCLGGRAEK